MARIKLVPTIDEVLKEDVAITNPELAQQVNNVNAALIAKDKQITALQNQILNINKEKQELEKAKGAIEQKSAQDMQKNQDIQAKQAEEQAKQAATMATSGQQPAPGTAPVTTQNSSFPDILIRKDNELSEDVLSDLLRDNPNLGRYDWQKPGAEGMGNWYQRGATGGHKPTKERAPKPKLMDYKRKMKIQDMENEIEDLRSDIDSLMSRYKAPDFEGAEGEIENFFGEIGMEAAEILNSGAYKTDKEKIKALKAVGIEKPEAILQDYYYYYPEFDQSQEKERKKAEKEAEKIQGKIDKIQAKIDKWEEIYESLNESSYNHYMKKLEAEYDSLQDRLADLINNKGSQDEIEDIKYELRQLNLEIKDLEDQDELDMSREEERYREQQEEDERDYYDRQPAEGEYESFNPAAATNFYTLNETFIEVEGEKKTPEGYLEKDYVFYVRVTEEGNEFIGKIFKDSPDEDWYGLVKVGDSDTFEKMSYQPDYNEVDIVDFLSGTYEDVEIIDEEEFDELVEDNDYEEEEITNESSANQYSTKANIREDAKDLLQNLIDNGIVIKGYVNSTGSGALGKNKLHVQTKHLNYSEFAQLIKTHYKKSGDTSLSSSVYSYKNLHFFYYQENDFEYTIVVRRKKYKK